MDVHCYSNDSNNDTIFPNSSPSPCSWLAGIVLRLFPIYNLQRQGYVQPPDIFFISHTHNGQLADHGETFTEFNKVY